MVKLLIIGSFRPVSFEKQLKKLIVDLKIKDDVIFIPFQNNPVPYYQAIDILVCPSYEEAFGRVNLEALACGKPVVAYNSGGIPYIIEHQKSGLLVNKGNLNELKISIIKLMSDKKLYNSISQYGPDYVQNNFSINLTVEKIAKIYDEITGKL